MLERRIEALEKRSVPPDTHVVIVNNGESLADAIKRCGAVEPFVIVPAKEEHHAKS